jgi:hypothetical protein
MPGTVRYIKLEGENDGAVLKEVAWLEATNDPRLLRPLLVDEVDGSLQWKGTYDAMAVRAIDRHGLPGARYSFWDFRGELEEIERKRLERYRQEVMMSVPPNSIAVDDCYVVAPSGQVRHVMDVTPDRVIYQARGKRYVPKPWGSKVDADKQKFADEVWKKVPCHYDPNTDPNFPPP